MGGRDERGALKYHTKYLVLLSIYTIATANASDTLVAVMGQILCRAREGSIPRFF